MGIKPWSAIRYITFAVHVGSMRQQILHQYHPVCVMTTQFCCRIQNSNLSTLSNRFSQIVSIRTKRTDILGAIQKSEHGGILDNSFSITLRRRVSMPRIYDHNRIENTIIQNENDIGIPQLRNAHHDRSYQFVRTRSRSTSSSAANVAGYWDTDAISDLFDQYAKVRKTDNDDDGSASSKTLDMQDLHDLLIGIGRNPNSTTLHLLFKVADLDGNGTIDSKEFLENADALLGDSPARIILVVGGPGSGKGVLSKRLERECNVVHLSSGDLLRQEVELQTPLGKTVKDIMSRGELVSSAVMVALMKKRMKDHPGKRVLLDGFPRSNENAKDLITLCGKPELALHLVCDDTILMERIMTRGIQSQQQSGDDAAGDTKAASGRRVDDNFFAALTRLRTFHKHHNVTLEWLRNEHIPIINLDCTGSPESVWQQLVSIGRLMRPAVKLDKDKMRYQHFLEKPESSTSDDWSNDPNRISDDPEELTVKS